MPLSKTKEQLLERNPLRYMYAKHMEFHEGREMLQPYVLAEELVRNTSLSNKYDKIFELLRYWSQVFKMAARDLPHKATPYIDVPWDQRHNQNVVRLHEIVNDSSTNFVNTIAAMTQFFREVLFDGQLPPIKVLYTAIKPGTTGADDSPDPRMDHEEEIYGNYMAVWTRSKPGVIRLNSNLLNFKHELPSTLAHELVHAAQHLLVDKQFKDPKTGDMLDGDHGPSFQKMCQMVIAQIPSPLLNFIMDDYENTYRSKIGLKAEDRPKGAEYAQELAGNQGNPIIVYSMNGKRK